MLLDNQKQKIMEEFTKSRSNKIYANAFAKENKLNQKTTANNLHYLEEKGILKFKQEGKNKYFFLNEKNPELKEILKIVEIQKKIEFINKNNILRDLFKKLQENSKGILIVFGSYVKGNPKKDSDLDIIILGETKGISSLEEDFGIEINLIESNKNKFNLKEPLIKEIMENHIILKGVEDFVELVW